jgi:hypothetical protein
MSDDRDLAEALRGLAQSTTVPPPDTDRERALLEAFDTAWERKRLAAPVARRRPAVAAALIALAATVAWMVANRSGPAPAPARPSVAPLTTTEFVIWPGAAELPRFESGHLMRMSVPVSALSSLGLVPPASNAPVVQADVLIGQDGLPRAVRLSPDF